MLSNVTLKGLEAQLKAELRANELGYIVSKPTTECCRYDMIIDDGNSLKKIQVKYCDYIQNTSNGAVQLHLSKKSINGVERPYYTKDEVDAIVVYIKPIDKLCYLPIDIIENKKYISLRYKDSKNNQKKGIYNCSDYFW